MLKLQSHWSRNLILIQISVWVIWSILVQTHRWKGNVNSTEKRLYLLPEGFIMNVAVSGMPPAYSLQFWYPLLLGFIFHILSLPLFFDTIDVFLLRNTTKCQIIFFFFWIPRVRILCKGKRFLGCFCCCSPIIESQLSYSGCYVEK